MVRSVLIVMAILSITSSPAFAEKKTLNLFIWSEYIDPEVVADFEKKFGCTVNIDLFEDMEGLLGKLAAGGDSLYDVVVPSDYMVPVLVRRGLLQPLRRERIPNFSNIESRFANPPFDRGNVHTVAYQWGTVGVYARKKAGETLDETWGLFFDKSKQPGPFVIIDSMRDAMTTALKYLGHSVNSKNPAELAKARDLLIESKQRSLGFEVPIGGKNRVLAGAARMAVVYNGDAVRGMAEDSETYYFIPREGSQIWLDSLAIPAKAPHRELAEEFINYILEPAVGARISDFNQFATPNRESLSLIDPADRSNPAIYPNDETMRKLEFLEDLGETTRLYDEIWTQVKSR